MKRNKLSILLLAAVLLVCFLLTGCSGLIKPTIGEMGAAADEAETVQTTAGGEASSEPAGNASGEASGETSSGSEEPTAEPMEGNVVYRFEHRDRVSSSLGAMNDLLIVIELYDTPNANGDTCRISTTVGSSTSSQDCTWTLEDGVFILQLDEFRTYESRDIEGVPTIVGVSYGFMMNRGTADVPLVEGDVGSFVPENTDSASAEASGEASAS